MTSGRRLRPLNATRVLLMAALFVAVMTIVSSAQHAAVQSAAGLRIDVTSLLAHQAIHWLAWAILIPVLYLGVRRFRLDVAERRSLRFAALLAIGLTLSLAQSVMAGALVSRFLPGPQIAAGVSLSSIYPRQARATPTASHGATTVAANRAFVTMAPNFIIVLLLAGVLHAHLYYTDLRARREREVQLEGRLARAELDVLRSQLQPHFLFNTLHAASGLMLDDVPSARRVLVSLGELLRMSLEQLNQPQVRLGEEVAFVEKYIEIQQARFGDRLRVSVSVPESLRDVMVPALLLQPLVENAIRHGIEPSVSGGRVDVHAAERDGSLVIRVCDDGGGRLPIPSRAPGRGLGLSNTAARLEQLYGDAHSFTAGPRNAGGFEVDVVIPLRTSTAARMV